MKRSNSTQVKLSEVDYAVGDVLVVQWLDAHNLDAGWQPVRDVKYSRAEVQTVGHFLAVEDKQLWLACDFCKEDEMVNTVVGIPVSWVMDIRKIDIG